MKKRPVFVLLTVIAAVVAVAISWGNTTIREDWEKVSISFMKDNKPYGPALFSIRDDQVMSFKLAEPDLLPTEHWNVNELESRRTVRILNGYINGPVWRIFDQPGQWGTFWISPDWNVLYVSTGWMDSYQKPVSGKYKPQLTKLFKSTDQGQTWQQLNWQEDANIGQMAFLDKQRGYLVGWGAHIWRTADGGTSRTEIPVPPQVIDTQKPRKEFDMVALGKNSVLRFSFTVHNPQQQSAESQVYAPGWNDTAPFPAFTLPDQVVKDIIDGQHGLYIVSQRGISVFKVDKLEKTTLFRFADQRMTLIHEFKPGFRGYSRYMTPGGGLLMGLEDATNSKAGLSGLMT